ncbi:MAG: hypothetical protein JXO49_06305 [Deltaproteobacteria bacterium]|nr:hypothetical protein [Candidatus Anaeroferrophillus wilburensis]MBN2888938.1 hypothetical protein [Deltaproteobacteria bacterium]
MAIDKDKKESDHVYEIAGFEYLVDKDFMVKAAPIKVDFNGFGFQLTSNVPIAGGGSCGGCGSSSSCCS